MKLTKIVITLKSAASFGVREGAAGLVDHELQHDGHGFPFLRGKTLKGLLAESAANVVYHLNSNSTEWLTARNQLFGIAGNSESDNGILHIGDARLPDALRFEVVRSGWDSRDVLYSLTGIRHRISINEDGVPGSGSLHSMRVLVRGVKLESKIFFEREPAEIEKQLLAVAVLDFRHAGSGRNRGWGWLKADLEDEDITRQLFQGFGEAIR